MKTYGEMTWAELQIAQRQAAWRWLKRERDLATCLKNTRRANDGRMLTGNRFFSSSDPQGI